MKDLDYTINGSVVTAPDTIVSRYDRYKVNLSIISEDAIASVKVHATYDVDGSTTVGTSYNMTVLTTLTYYTYLSGLIDALDGSGATNVSLVFETYDSSLALLGTYTANAIGIFNTNINNVTSTDLDALFVALNKLTLRVEELEGE